VTYSAGDEVRIVALRKNARVLERTADDRYRVALGRIVMLCAAGDLEPVTAPRKGRKSSRPSAATAHATKELRTQDPARLTLDLHGCTVEEAVRRLDLTLNAAFLADASQVEIIHGHGTGRIRDAVQRHLKTISAVKRFGLDPGNPGVTRVWL
jgi:DNA mismatch repair protein MutS2